MKKDMVKNDLESTNNFGKEYFYSLYSPLFENRQQVVDDLEAAQTNFATIMPKAKGDLAQEYFKDPYRFEFAQLNEEYTEKEPLHRLADLQREE